MDKELRAFVVLLSSLLILTFQIFFSFSLIQFTDQTNYGATHFEKKNKVSSTLTKSTNYEIFFQSAYEINAL